MTVQPYSKARYRDVPPIPQPTSRTLMSFERYAMLMRSLTRFNWAISLDSDVRDASVGQYPWWMCSPLYSNQFMMMCHVKYSISRIPKI